MIKEIIVGIVAHTNDFVVISCSQVSLFNCNSSAEPPMHTIVSCRQTGLIETLMNVTPFLTYVSSFLI